MLLFFTSWKGGSVSLGFCCCGFGYFCVGVFLCVYVCVHMCVCVRACVCITYGGGVLVGCCIVVICLFSGRGDGRC